MKLKNKKTGEIVILQGELTYGDKISHYGSLAELNEEWEDYEEPKESEYYWYIGYKNDIRRTKYHHTSDFADNQVTETRKEIGNCFESLEEAEKAVEKLKAWKRLKEAGFEFGGWTHTPITESLTGYNLHIKAYTDKLADYMDDLQLLFGGEE